MIRMFLVAVIVVATFTLINLINGALHLLIVVNGEPLLYLSKHQVT